jgi:hypothetical protein
MDTVTVEGKFPSCDRQSEQRQNSMQIAKFGNRQLVDVAYESFRLTVSAYSLINKE